MIRVVDDLEATCRSYDDLKAKLLETGDAELVESNWWHDYFWGVCNGRGENHLGKILMKIRAELATRRPVRLCISGSRDFVNLHLVEQVLACLPPDTVIIHGGARGVDMVADRAARKLGLAVEVFPAEWNKYGRAAGMIRNREMLKRADKLIAFWNGKSPGTRGAVEIAKELEVDALVIDDKAEGYEKAEPLQRAVGSKKPEDRERAEFLEKPVLAQRAVGSKKTDSS